MMDKDYEIRLSPELFKVKTTI